MRISIHLSSFTFDVSRLTFDHSYQNSAKFILGLYDGSQPFSIFLKNFFSQNKKYGSRDRKAITELCYSHFRSAPFPWKEELSEGIDYESFLKSFQTQPDLFLRVRPGNEKMVKEKLNNAGIEFREANSTCLALPNSSKIDQVIELDKEAVVQDLNSQKVGEFLPRFTFDVSRLTLWDCCAASGGKSILAYDLLKNIDLTVSDIRESILVNLRKRFMRAGIKDYKSLIIDLSKLQPLRAQRFDLIILDAPCTGSGTWSRTPEQLFYFKKEKIDYYSNIQKRIAQNVIPHLNENGKFLYITCSVFKKENEEVVDFITKNSNLKIEKMELLKGYDKKADTLFACLFS